jgi:hypothetical protein
MTAPSASRAEVVVVDVQMPFISMVIFMVKFTIASIPAFLILAVLGAVIAGLLGGIVAGLTS